MRRLRYAGLLAVAAGVTIGVSGCNTASLDKQELVVYFTQNATAAQHLAALHNCGHVSPEVVPEKVETNNALPSQQVGDIRFLTDHADDKEVAEVEACLQKQPGVVGVDVPDLTD